MPVESAQYRRVSLTQFNERDATLNLETITGIHNTQEYVLEHGMYIAGGHKDFTEKGQLAFFAEWVMFGKKGSKESEDQKPTISSPSPIPVEF